MWAECERVVWSVCVAQADNLCAATSYVTSLLNPLFHLHIVSTTCISLGLTHACNHANRVSGLNKYSFHVESPWGFKCRVSYRNLSWGGGNRMVAG